MFLPQLRDLASQPYKTTGKLMVLYILVLIFVDNRQENRRFCTEWYQAFHDFNLTLISSLMEYGFVRDVPKYVNCSTLSKDLKYSHQPWKWDCWKGISIYSISKSRTQILSGTPNFSQIQTIL